MTTRSATEVVLLTPEGRGAVASLLVEGPQALEIVATLFHPAGRRALADQPLGRIVFGRWQSIAGEEIVVCRRAADRIEIHCHGGQAAAAAIAESLADRGCERTTWHEWVQRSAGDPISAAALQALAEASTERTAAILVEQHGGALRRALDEISAELAAGRGQQAGRLVDALIARAGAGLHLVVPWRVVLAGAANVGKSSLVNALLGYRRAIVHDTPGTTRDVVTALTAFDGWPVELADTAGLHASTDPLEASGIRLAQTHLHASDLVVLVFDASRPWSDEDQALATRWPHSLHVLNKCDLLRGPLAADDPRAGALHSSTVDGEGIAELACEIATRLIPTVPDPGAAVPFTARQVQSLRKIREAIERQDPQTALALLARRDAWESDR